MLRSACAVLVVLCVAACGQRTAQPVAAQGSTPGAVVPGDVPPTIKADAMPTNPVPGEAGKITRTDAEWKKALTEEQYRVLREKGTERAFTGTYWKNEGGPGEYRCAACRAVLFRGTDKFVSDCGWPAFDKAIKGTIDYHTDRTLGMSRTEVTCARCGGHLGHVFDDGPTDTGIRYCINSVSIDYVPDTANKDAPTEAGGR